MSNLVPFIINLVPFIIIAALLVLIVVLGTPFVFPIALAGIVATAAGGPLVE
jgi:hypothetical protein